VPPIPFYVLRIEPPLAPALLRGLAFRRFIPMIYARHPAHDSALMARCSHWRGLLGEHSGAAERLS
jgi:hypothetical protein